jgi:hypothetical protein
MQPVKNKKLTYLLICAVAAVWGIILYRVFFNEAADEYEPTNQHSQIEKDPYDQYVAREDTFRLVLNYRDPFLGTLQNDVVDKSTSAISPQVNIPVAPPPPPIDWSFVKYSGYVVNPKTKTLVSIISVNGVERMIAEGETFGGVRLLKNKRDSILISWQGKNKHIKQ